MRLIQFVQRQFAHAPMRTSVAISASLRGVWLLLALPGLLFQVHLERFWHVGENGLGYFHSPWQVVDIWTRWDAMFYLQIAESGYKCGPDYLCTAFFPLYSLLIAATHRVTGLSYVAAGLATANIFDVLGLALVALWCARRVPGPQGFWAFAAFAVFPTRNFGFSVYTEGLFVSASVGAYLAYETRRYALAGALGFLCSACRPQGVCVGLSLLVDALAVRAKQLVCAPSVRAVCLLGTAPLGLVSYMIYLYCAFGDPFMFVRVQHVWHRRVQAPWHIIGVHAEPIEYIVLFVAVYVCVASIRGRAKIAESLYVGLCLLVPMSTGRFTSINRFVGVLFPLFALGVLIPKRRWLGIGYWLLCAAYTAVFAFKLGQGAKVI